jgi:small-conductance mechanosensitive channel
MAPRPDLRRRNLQELQSIGSNLTVDGFLQAVREAFAWAPDWLAAVAVLAAAVCVALLVHRLALGALRRTLGLHHPFLRRLIEDTRGPSRLALIVFALSAALQAAPLSASLKTGLTHMLLVAFVVLVGWIAHVAIAIASRTYLGRFQLDTEDNLLARKHVTQVRILYRATDTLIVVVTLAAAMMTFDSVRQYGVSLFASAGVAGLAVGLAARPLFSNLIAGVQLAVTQPIRLDDVVIVENEFGRVEEINSTYVVLRLWDLRRMIVPLTYFIEKPFQNWTRASAQIIGTAFFYVDYSVPVAKVRAKAEEVVRASKFWDGQVVNLQVTDCKDATVELRVLASAATSSAAFDLRCEIREKLVDYLQREHPGALPRQREEVLLPENLSSNGHRMPSHQTETARDATN